MEFGTIEREIYVEASPEIVFEVVSSPDHLKEWWPEDAQYDPEPGSAGEIVFGDRGAGGTVVPFTVVDVRPPRTFSFRWTHPAERGCGGGQFAAGHLRPHPFGRRDAPQDDRDRIPRNGLGGRRSSRSSTGTRAPAGTSICRGSRQYVATLEVQVRP